MAEFKGEFALSGVPNRHHGVDRSREQLSVFQHHLMRRLTMHPSVNVRPPDLFSDCGVDVSTGSGMYMTMSECVEGASLGGPSA